MQPAQAMRAPADLELENLASQIRSRVKLSTEEKNWLASKPKINVRVGDYPPFHFVANGVPQGLSIDYLRTFCMVYSLDCNYVAGITVPQSIRSMTEPNGITVQVGWQKNAERERVAIFTGPYVSSPFVIFGRDSDKHIFSMDDLAGKRVVVEKGYAIHGLLQSRFPDLQLIEVETSTAALKYLASHQADAYVSSLMAGHYLIHKLGLSNIEALAPAPFEPNHLEIAVRRDWPLLASLISKAQSAVSDDEHLSLRKRWLSVRVMGLISKEQVLLYVAMATATIVLLLFIGAIVANRRLRREVTARTVAQHQYQTSEVRLRETMDVLSQSEEKYRDLVDNSLIGVFNTDLTGQFVFVNDAMVQMYDFDSIEQMLTTTTLTIWANLEDRKHMLSLLNEHGRVDNFEAETITLTGRRIHVLFSAALHDGIITGMVMNITERKLAEEQVRKSESKYRVLLENLPQKIFLKDMQSTYLSCNENYARDLGIMPEEIAGKTDYDFFPGELADKYRGDDQRILESGQVEMLEEEYEQDGKRTWVSIIKIPVRDKRGMVTSLLGIFMDITERKQAEEKLQQYQQRLKSLAVQLTLAEEQERRCIAEDLHDHVGQSLAFTRMQLAAARKGLPKDDKRDALFEEISQTLLKAIQDTRHLIFELSSPSLKELGLSAAISEWMEQQIEDKRGIGVEVFDHAQNLSLDDDLRAILFRNVRELLTNAIKYAQAKNVSVWLERVAGQLEITIQDDGVGFDPGKVAQSSNGHRGFGLFSVQERMVDLGGKLIIVSRPGSGSKLILQVPIQPLNADADE